MGMWEALVDIVGILSVAVVIGMYFWLLMKR